MRDLLNVLPPPSPRGKAGDGIGKCFSPAKLIFVSRPQTFKTRRKGTWSLVPDHIKWSRREGGFMPPSSLFSCVLRGQVE